MQFRVICILSLFLSAVALGKEKQLINIEVVESQSIEHVISQLDPGTAPTRVTDCQANPPVISGNMVYSTADCTTTTTPGNPMRVQTTRVAQEKVLIKMPDGSQLTALCKDHCYHLERGSYSAEISGNDLWIYSYEPLSHKERKAKYRATGTSGTNAKPKNSQSTDK